MIGTITKNPHMPKMMEGTAASNSTAVLTEFGYSADEVDALMAKGVVCGTERKR